MTTQKQYGSFKTFFARELRPHLERFEKLRKQRLMLYCGIGGFAGLLCLLFIIAFHEMGGRFVAGVGAIIIAGAAGLIHALDATFFRPHKLRADFSKEVLTRCVNYALPGLEYRNHGYIPASDFLASGLFPAQFNVYRGRDMFWGGIGGCQLAFSWMKVEYVQKNNKGKSSSRLVFSGWLYKATFPRSFVGGTLVLPDHAEAGMGWFGRAIQEFTTPRGVELLLLEDPDFEKLYKAMSTGQLDARYILTPAVMREMAQLGTRLKSRICFSFTKNRMYMAVPDVNDTFDSMLTSSLVKPDNMQHFFNTTKGIATLAATIAAHTKVWDDA